MTDIAEPHTSSRTWLADRRPDRCASISRCSIDGSAGLAFMRYGNSSKTSGSGRSRPSVNSAVSARSQVAKEYGAGEPA